MDHATIVAKGLRVFFAGNFFHAHRFAFHADQGIAVAFFHALDVLWIRFLKVSSSDERTLAGRGGRHCGDETGGECGHDQAFQGGFHMMGGYLVRFGTIFMLPSHS